MTYYVTCFKSASDTINGEVRNYETFKELGTLFQNTRTLNNKKNCPNFIRGKLDPPDRKNKNLISSRLLVADIDHTHVPIKTIAERLQSLGYSFVIHTTFSHTLDDMCYRAIIDAVEYKEEHRKGMITSLSEELRIRIDNASKTWSQCFFLPSVKKGNEKSAIKYHNYEGVPYEIKETEEKSEKSEKETVEDGRGQEGVRERTLDTMREEIIDGTNLHVNCRDIMLQHIRDYGEKHKAHTLSELTTYLKLSIANSERPDDVQVRIDDLPRLWDESRVLAEPDFEMGTIVDDIIEDLPIPKPPGLLGVLHMEILDMMRYKDDRIALVITMFILASIVGRKFNVDKDDAKGRVDPLALNMYLTLAAGTGVGKDEIKTIVNKMSFQIAVLDCDPNSFFFSGRVNGVRPLYRTFKDQRSLGIINGEAGVGGQSQVGDKEGLKQFWLGVYSQGHWNAKTDVIGYSSAEHTVESIQSVAISRVSESTPVELFRYYSQDDVMENGLVPRESVFRISNPNPTLNRKRRVEFSKATADKMRYLVTMCGSDVDKDEAKTHIITSKDNNQLERLITLQEHYRKKHLRGESLRDRAMSSRMFVKVMKYVGICVVMNHSKEDEDNLLIDDESLAWAIKMGEYEIETLDTSFAGMDSDLELTGAVREVIKKLNTIVNDTCANKGKVNILYRRAKLIPYSRLSQLCVNTTVIKKFDNSRYGKIQQGLDRVVEYMVTQGMIDIVKNDPFGKVKKLIKINQDIMEYI